MVSRRRLLPWIQSSLRRGGLSISSYMLLALIFTTSIVTLFIRTTGNESLDTLDPETDPKSTVKFVSPDPIALQDHEKSKEKALLKQMPYPDSISNLFNEKAVPEEQEAQESVEMKKDVQAETNEEVKIEKLDAVKNTDGEDDDGDDFKNIAGEEFVPPDDDITKMVKGIGPMIQSSLNMFKGDGGGSPYLDIASKVVPVLAKTFSGNDEGSPMMNLIGNALPMLLGQSNSFGNSLPKGDPGSSSGLETAISLAKMFLNTKSGSSRKERPNRSNDIKTADEKKEKNQEENKSELKTPQRSSFLDKEATDNSKAHKSNWVEDPKEISRIPLSAKDVISESNVHSEKENVWIKKIKKEANKIALKNSSVPKWIKDCLGEKRRVEAAGNIEKIYNLLMRSNRGFQRDLCDTVVPFSKDGSDWKEDDFQGTQFICMDLDFEVYFKQHCTVYSFGIGQDWGFEEAMQEKGCEVWAFDINSSTEKPISLGSNIHFYNNVSLGTKNEEKNIDGKRVMYYTLQTIITKLRHSKRNINYLKINLNGEEWPILEQIINQTPLLLNNVLQIGLKTHLHTAMMDPSLYGQYLNILNQLPALGYQLFNSAKVQDNSDDVYPEPFLNNKTVSLTNHAAYFRL